MARSRPSRNAARSAKCSCNPGWLILAVILFAIGLYGVVGGFVAQNAGATATTVLPWYFIGILLIVFGKLAKWKSCGMCTMHG